MEKSLKNTKKPMGLSTKIFIALIAGAISGVLIHYFMPAGYIRDSVIVEGVLYVIGQGFIRLMQMLVVPLVFCSLICGSMAIGDTKTLGKVGIKTILFYLLTTAVAVSVALSVAMLINPGIGVTIENVSKSSVTITEKQPLTQTLLNIIPKNPVESLATADMLNRRGHSVTVFEREDKIGGLLRYGIPNMKLEKQFIDRKIAIMEEEGVQFVTGCNIGKDKKAATLLKEFDRVVLCCGASNPRDIKVPGREAEGIYFAVDFLKSTTKALWKNAKQNADGTYDLNLKDGTYISAKGKNVMVIGGGDTGNDCVGTSMRHGAKSVLQLEMMPKAPDERTEMNPWPEWPRVCKTDYGQQEAAAVFGHDPRVYQTTVKEFKKDKNGKVCKAVLVKLEPKKDEKTGRMMMAEVAGSEYTVDVDLVLIAAGFLGSQDYVTKAFGVEVNERTNVKTAAGAYSTNVKNVFTAGDMHRGQSLVVWAIREGREAAKAVDISLMGYTNMYVQ